MKRIFAILITLVFILVSIGCGSNDKFAGQWVGICEKNEKIAIYDIQKNGQGYVIDIKILSLPSLWVASPKNGEKYIEKWSLNDNNKGIGATVNDNLLTIPDGFIGTMNLTYIEKDNIIQVPSLGMLPGFAIERNDDGKKLEELKKEIISGRKSVLENRCSNLIYDVEEMEQTK